MGKAMNNANIFAAIPEDLQDEYAETLVRSGSLLVERIVSRGQATPAGQWYDQERNEWVLLLAGSAGLRLEGRDGLIIMKPGDHLLLPAHCRHRVEWTDSAADTVWLTIHYRD